MSGIMCSQGGHRIAGQMAKAFSSAQTPRHLCLPGILTSLLKSASPPSAETASFQACTALSHINADMPEPDAANPNRCLQDCCFLEAGIVALALPIDFNTGSTACAANSCKLLILSQTEDHGIRSLPQVYLSTAGSTQFRATCKQRKAKHGEGHILLTNVGNSTSPNGTEFRRQMPVIYGEKTF